MNVFLLINSNWTVEIRSSMSSLTGIGIGLVSKPFLIR